MTSTADDENIEGGEVPLDEKTIVLGLGPQVPLNGLPQGNRAYEKAFSTCCREKATKLKANGYSIHRALCTEGSASDFRMIAASLGVVETANGRSMSVTSASTTFYRESTNRRIKQCWKDKSSKYRYRKITDWKTLRDKIKAAYSSRWEKAVREVYNEDTARRARRVTLDIATSAQVADARAACNKALAEIHKCSKIEDFILVYEIGGVVGEALERITTAVGTQDPDEWSKDWAERLVENELAAECLDCDRKLGMLFLLKLHDRWKKDGTVTDGDMSERLQSKMVYRVLRLCLPMNRARVLFAESVAGRGPVGAHWVSQRHVKEDPEKWGRIAEEHPDTIDERFFSFVEFEPLRISKVKAILEWLKPKEAQSFQDRMDSSP